MAGIRDQIPIPVNPMPMTSDPRKTWSVPYYFSLVFTILAVDGRPPVVDDSKGSIYRDNCFYLLFSRTSHFILLLHVEDSEPQQAIT